ncbi:MAG: hypothetical protein ACI8QT_000331 [Halioglobus sp.]|jgi:uncharacterized protein YigA (DUF484 family)
MSGKQNPAGTQVTLNDELVRDYLMDNDSFLQRNPDMLDFLHIPHASGSAVSLVEKQACVLREKNVEMRHRLKALSDNARENDLLFERTRTLVLSLLEAESLEALYRAFNKSMSNDFDVEYASMVLFGDYGEETGDCRLDTAENSQAQIGALLKSGKPICGTLRKEELSYLFPKSGDVGSAAVMPLDGEASLGLIAVGSSDANRYNNMVGTLFISQIADVIVRLLPRFRAA